MTASLYTLKNQNKIMPGNRLIGYSTKVQKKTVCGMWDGLDLATPETNMPKRRKVESKCSDYQFQSSSSSSLLFWTGAVGDMGFGFITTPNPPVLPRRSPSSSSSEVCAADLPGIGFSICVGDTEATNGFVDIDAPVIGEGVGVDHAFMKD